MTLTKILKSIINVKGMLIHDATFNQETNEISITVDQTKGYKQHCPICGKKCSGYDLLTQNRKWRSLDFGPCKVYLISTTRRIQCKVHGVLSESVCWADHGSPFTKEFERQIAYLALRLNKTEVSVVMRIAWNTVGAILSRIKSKLEPDSRVRHNNLKRIGIDETSYRKGHKYITVITDHDTNQVIWTKIGKSSEVLDKFFGELTAEQRATIQLVSADGARWIKRSVEKWIPQAELCIDAFHVVSWAIEAMDKMRKSVWRNAKEVDKKRVKRTRGRPGKDEATESKETPKLKGTKYALGKNPENLTTSQSNNLEMVKTMYPKLYKGYLLKEALRRVFQCRPSQIKKELDAWLSWACRCRILEFVELSKKIRRHYHSIISTVKHNLSNARIESMNNKIKVMIRKAYGFRNIQNMIDLIMIVCSNLFKDIKLAYQLRDEKIEI